MKRGEINLVLSKVGIPPALQKKRVDKHRRKQQPRPSEQVEEGKYRNRALERAQLKEEYKKVQEEFELLRTQTEQESRYMGGDIEFTHLVKGLDYALLEKIKKQLNSQNTTDTVDSVAVDSVNQELGIGFTEFGFYLYKTFFYHTNINNINFQQRLNNTIHLLKHGNKLRIQGGAVVYNFNLGNNYQFLPNITINDCFTMEHQSTHDKSYITTHKELMEVLSWHMENKRKRKQDRLPFRPTNTAITGDNSNTRDTLDTVEKDEDIYEGIGSYDGTELNVELLNPLEGQIFTIEREAKTCYKVPEKLLKHKATLTQPNQPDIELDFDDDQQSELSNKSKKSKRVKKRNWDEIEKIMKDKNPSLDNFKTADSKPQNFKFT